MSKARCDIAGFLDEKGPSLSSSVVDHLCATFDISRVAARQRVSRAGGEVRRLDGIGLPDRESFLYLPEHKGTDFFRQRLAAAFIKKNSTIGAALLAIVGRGGYVSAKHFPTICGAPFEALRGHITAPEVLHILKQFDLIQESWRDDSGVVYRLSYREPILQKSYRASLLVEEIAIEHIRQWLSRLNLCTSTQTRSDEPKCNCFAFDVVGRSKLRHFYSGKDDQCDAFSVCDVNLISEKLSERDLMYFFKKVDASTYSRKRQNIIPFYFAYDFTLECIKDLKRRGVVHGRLRDVFGKDFVEILCGIYGVLSDVNGYFGKNPESAESLVSNITRIEGNSFNLRSVALQFIIAHRFYIEGYHTDINKVITTMAGDSAEIDVFCDRSDSLISIECKALSAKNECNAETVNAWLADRYPRLLKWKRENFGGKAMCVVFCVSTAFRDRNKIVPPKSTADCSFALWDKDKIRAELNAFSLSNMLKIFDEHFSKGYT